MAFFLAPSWFFSARPWALSTALSFVSLLDTFMEEKTMSTTLLLPQHFTSRPATLDDVEAVVDLLNACSIEQIGKPRTEAHRIRSD